MSPDTAHKCVEAWIVKQLSYFDPLAWNDENERLARRKAFAELSLLLCFKAWCGAEVPRTLSRFVIGIVNSPAFLGLATRKPDEFLLYAPCMSYAAVSGALTSSATVAIQTMGAEAVVIASERVPYRHLDYILHRELVLQQTSFDERIRESVLSLSILRHRVPVGNLSIDDAYALTHSLFYATKLGSDCSLFHDRPELLPRLEDIDAAICRFVAEDNLDVALEMAISRMILSKDSSPALDFCITHSIEQFEMLGHLPAPGEAHKHEETWSDEFRDWHGSYHTTMLLGLALDFAECQKVPISPVVTQAPALKLYGHLLEAMFNANVFESCVLAGKLLKAGIQDLPDPSYQLCGVARMLQRHLVLVHQDGDCGFLVDAFRMGELSRTSGVGTSMESVNRLARLVLKELLQLSTNPECVADQDLRNSGVH